MFTKKKKKKKIVEVDLNGCWIIDKVEVVIELKLSFTLISWLIEVDITFEL